MDERILYMEYARIVVIFIVLFAITIKLIVKKELLSRLAFSEETNKKINIVMTPIIYALLLWLLYFHYPILLDIPNCMSGNYCYGEGVSKSNDYSDENYIDRRSVDMEINGDTKRMYLYSCGIREGDRCVVVYLPHSNVGQAVPVDSVGNHKMEDR